MFTWESGRTGTFFTKFQDEEKQELQKLPDSDNPRNFRFEEVITGSVFSVFIIEKRRPQLK